MLGVQRAIHHDVGAGRAQVGRRARLAVAQPAEQLRLERDRKVLILQHRLRRGRMEHQPVVAYRPRRTAFDLLADEAVFRREDVVGKGILVEDVAELAVERRPLVVADLEQAVLDAERCRTGSRRGVYFANFGVQPVRSLPLKS